MGFENEMDELVNTIVKSMIKIYDEPAIPLSLAKYCWTFYTALVANGFTQEQAMQIIVNLKFPELKK